MSHIDHDQLDALKPHARQRFLEAQPYPYLMIDGFLKPESYRAVLAALPAPREKERSSDYMFARNKYENPIFDEAAPVLAELRRELVGEAFVEFLRTVYDKPVFVDESFVGGGLHQGGAGSFLDMHADFSRHPVNRDWVRELNILLYLNHDYDEAWGGHLEMRHAETGAAGRVAPVGNRMVIMLTKAHTLHGYKEISFPPGRQRTSIASYAYTVDQDYETTPERSTLWRPQDAGVVKQALAHMAPTLVSLKRSLLGSSTAKRAERKKR
jgi:2OG-Fe(II) oxygenase superfamily